MTAPQTTTFRDLWQALSPPFLQGYYGVRFGYTLGIQWDGLAQAIGYANFFRVPTRGPTQPNVLAPADAFPYMSADRQIDIGENETLAAFADRLRQYLDLWRAAGSNNAILTAIDSFLTPFVLNAETVKQARTSPDLSDWDIFNGTTGVTTNSQQAPHNWDWDSDGRDPGMARFQQASVNGVLTPWWRTWIILYVSGKWTNEGTWGDGQTWGDGGTWGSNATPQEVASVRKQVQKWKSGASIVQWVIVSFDSTWFQYTLPLGNAKMPDGHWGRWGKISGGVYVPSRTSAAVYWDGTP